MTSEKQSEASIFNAAREIESASKRSAYLDEVCGGDENLRGRVDKLLAAFHEESQFLERPAPGLERTVVPASGSEDFTASVGAGLTAVFGKESAVILGNTNHSILKSMSGSLKEVPRVSLREPKEAGEEPIQRPSSPEIPNQPSDSRYRLDGEIARGGMGAVLRGRDTDLGRDLAVKVLLDAHKDKPEVVQRFIEEAQIGGQLQHPGIAPVYELGQFADQRPFFSMKLVKGDTLSKLLSDRDEPTADRGKLIGIFEQVCQTMAYAHGRGVIHRDLKPANIMVGAFGEVQVMDWGLAKVLSAGGVADEKTARKKQNGETLIQTMRSVGSDGPGTVGSVGSETQMGSVMGTLAYMPPEQALGEIDLLDQRADVFGLGAILAEILTGQPPYVAGDGTQIYRMASRGKLGDCFDRLDACGADEELVSLAKQCLELEPDDRPKDANALAEQITGYLESVEAKLRKSEVERASEATRAVEQRKRFRVTLGLGAAALAILLAGTAATAWQAWEAKRQTLVAQDAREEATDQRDKAREAEQIAIKAKTIAEEAKLREEELARRRRRELYAADMQLADQLYNGQNGEQQRIEQLLASWIPVDDEEDLREFSWRYQWTRLYRSAAVTVPGCVGVAITPDGKMVVADSDGLHEVHEGGEKRELIRWKLDKIYAYFSPDGRWVASRFEAGIELYNIESGEKVLSLPVERCSFSADGKYFAAWKMGAKVDSLSADEDAIPVWRLEGENAVRIESLNIGNMKELPNDGFNLRLGSDGKSFLLRKSPGVVSYSQVGAFLNGNPEPVIWQHRSSANCAWSPDGRIIASTVGGTIELRLTLDVSQKKTLDKLRISSHGKYICTIRFSPDGKILATGGSDGTIDLWDVSELARAAEQLETHDQEISGTNDSKTSFIRTVPKPRLIRTIKAYTNPISVLNSALNFSDDARQLVSLASPRPGVGKLWSLDSVRGQYEMERVTDDLFGWIVPLKEEVFFGDFHIGEVLPSDVVQGSVEKGERITAIFDPRIGEWKTLGDVESWNAESWSDYMLLSQGPFGSTVRMRLENAQGEQHEVMVRRHSRPRQQDPRAYSVAFAPDGNSVLVAGTSLGATQLNLTNDEARRYPDRGRSVAYSPDGRLIAIDGYFGISIRDRESDKELYRLNAVPNGNLNVNTMAGNLTFSPDGKYLARVSGFQFHGGNRSDLNVWRTSDFKKIGDGPLSQENFTLQSIVFSPDSSQLLVGDSQGRVQIWNTSDWSSKGRLLTQQRGIGALAISSDGKRLFVGSSVGNAGVGIWNVETETELSRLGSRKNVGFLALSPDDRTLAVGGTDHNVVLWDVETGKRLQMIQAHSRSVCGVAFSKDGNRLATADGDAIVRIWDAASTDEIDKDPITFVAMARLGLLRSEQKRHEEAGALFSKVIELNHETQHLNEQQLSEIRRNQATALERQAQLMERHGRWDEALEYRTEIVRLEPDNQFHQYRVATAHLYLQKPEQFWQCWHEMLDQWGGTESPRIGERIAKLRLFADVPGRELQTACKFADLAFEKRGGFLASFDVLLKGMAEYRRGNFVEALKHFEDARIGFDGDTRLIGNGSMCQYFASMAHHRLGDSEAAKAAFLDAKDRQHAWETDLRKSIGGPWLDWQQTEVVRREAVALLGIDESRLDPPISDTSN